jgi:hypothetical protein
MIRGNGIEHNFPYVLWVLMCNVDIRRQTDVIGSKYHTTHLRKTAPWKDLINACAPFPTMSSAIVACYSIK